MSYISKQAWSRTREKCLEKHEPQVSGSPTSQEFLKIPKCLLNYSTIHSVRFLFLYLITICPQGMHNHCNDVIFIESFATLKYVFNKILTNFINALSLPRKSLLISDNVTQKKALIPGLPSGIPGVTIPLASGNVSTVRK